MYCTRLRTRWSMCLILVVVLTLGTNMLFVVNHRKQDLISRFADGQEVEKLHKQNERSIKPKADEESKHSQFHSMSLGVEHMSTAKLENKNISKPRPTLSKTLDLFCFDGSDWLDCKTHCKTNLNFQRANLKTDSGRVSIFIHNPAADVHVSASILNKGSWEGDLMHIVWTQLRKHEDAVFRDLGSHVGEYSLMAAKLGREAYALDPNIANIQRLCRSVQSNKLTSPVRIIYNAVSNKLAKVSLLPVSANNVGGTKLKEGGAIQTVRLDDLLVFIRSKTVVIKIDVEGMEDEALIGGVNFFKHNNVVFIAMEWGQHTTTKSGLQIIYFMRSHDLEPYDSALKHKLDARDRAKWGWDIFWSAKSNPILT